MEPLEKGGKAAFLLADNQQARGVYMARVHVAGSPYAVLEGRDAIHLMRWTPGLEACRGKLLDAVMQNGLPAFRAVPGAGRDVALG